MADTVLQTLHQRQDTSNGYIINLRVKAAPPQDFFLSGKESKGKAKKKRIFIPIYVGDISKVFLPFFHNWLGNFGGLLGLATSK